MQKFYTHVVQSGNKILVREFDGTKRVNRTVQYKPTFYVKSDKSKTKFKSISGESVEPIQFDNIFESKDWIKGYENMDNFPIFGTTQHNYSYISETYSGEIEYNFSKLSVWSLDIEVEAE